MPLSQDRITDETPLGAELVEGGATFRCWAPRARAVHVTGRFGNTAQWEPTEANLMVRDWRGYWSGFVPLVRAGDEYRFFVVGEGSSGFKRDPYARELTLDPPHPRSNCVVRSPDAYPWHDRTYRTPSFHDLIVYRLHVGTYYGPQREKQVGKFLDVLDRIDYLVALGVTAIDLLPVVEYAPGYSRGYEGGDLFSPEMDFVVGPDQIDEYLPRVNRLLERCSHAPLTRSELLPATHQLKALIDVCHAHGLAVLVDVIFDHASRRLEDQDESLWFFDRAAAPEDPNESLYFTNQDHEGRAYATWKREVRQFLVDNAKAWVREYHVDGLRYADADVLVRNNPRDGWLLWQQVTDAVRFAKPSSIQIAQYSPPDPRLTRSPSEGGSGFDAIQYDGLYAAVRRALGQAATGASASVDMQGLANSLAPRGFSARWRMLTYLESPEQVQLGRSPRLARLADSSNCRSWYARSRARLATGLLMTAPGIPVIFMGQELLEDKPWSEDLEQDPGSLLWWEGLQAGDRAMLDHLRFSQDLVRLRRSQPALRSDNINVYHVNDRARVLAFHRWLHDTGRDVVVAVSLSETAHIQYDLGLPKRGRYVEAFNSDAYDNWYNPKTVGNPGPVDAYGPSRHRMATSARVTIPANGLVVLSLQSS